MKIVKRRDFIKQLKKLGVVQIRQNATTHEVFRLKDKVTIIPFCKDVHPCLRYRILKQLQLKGQV